MASAERYRKGTRSGGSCGVRGRASALVDILSEGAAIVGRLAEVGRSLSATLARDMKAVRERDPAARSNLEILTCYPGLHALWFHRLAHAMWRREVPLLPRLVSQFGRFVTGIEIHPGASIGEGFFIDHGAGVVIGETSEVGNNVTLYQGVTLGGTGKETGKRHPTVGDNVVVGAHSQLLGSIAVGENVQVGAGSVLVHDAPDNTTVVGNPGRPVARKGRRVGIPDIDYTHLPDPMAEAMKVLVDRVVRLENELEELRKAAGDRGAPGGRAVAKSAAKPRSAAKPGSSPKPDSATKAKTASGSRGGSKTVPPRVDGTPEA